MKTKMRRNSVDFDNFVGDIKGTLQTPRSKYKGYLTHRKFGGKFKFYLSYLLSRKFKPN